jgi:wyosine [tRNA(Phe)-imidazoG37] synthetase (radical SAM superfamily)
MATFLFDNTIFGPVKSRRLGISLGINLLPNTRKVCNFNCIYCECGWNPETKIMNEELPSRKLVNELLYAKLTEMQKNGEAPDVITFAGNGEPTMHPKFNDIINDTIKQRNLIFPKARIAVLSNATLIYRSNVFDALLKVDQNILKLDSAIDNTVAFINQPPVGYTVSNIVEGLKKYNGNYILQTMFVKGNYNNTSFDNTTPAEIDAWLKVIELTKPSEVMIYTIARDTPAQGLEKISSDILNNIAQKVEALSIKVSISV